MRRSSHIISADGAHWVALLCPKYLRSLGGSEKTQMHFMDKNSGRKTKAAPRPVRFLFVQFMSPYPSMQLVCKK